MNNTLKLFAQSERPSHKNWHICPFVESRLAGINKYIPSVSKCIFIVKQLGGHLTHYKSVLAAVRVTSQPSSEHHEWQTKKESNLQLFITGRNFEGTDGDVLLTSRGCSCPPPAILCLQNLVPAPLNQEEDQSSNHHGN